jgi:hypothetical protein
MNEEKARARLVELAKCGQFIRADGGDTCTLDAQFDADDLDAIAWWLRNMPNVEFPRWTDFVS